MSITSHIKPKSLALYGVAIASVVILFKVVTAYGESNLKARSNINGRYLVTGLKLPQCSSEKPMLLTIQQSGVYLNGDLWRAETKIASKLPEKLHLKGKWEGDRLHLSGLIPVTQICDRGLTGALANEELVVNIQAALADLSSSQKAPKYISIGGDISISKVGEKLPFTAQLDTATPAPSPSPH